MTAPVLVSNEIIAALKAGSAQGIDVDQALDQLATLVEAAGRNTRKDLRSIKTAVGEAADGHTVVVGWDICHACKNHVMHCSCSGGPVQPPWIEKWVSEAYGSTPTPVGSPESQNIGLSAIEVSDSAKSAISKSADPPSPDLVACRECGTLVDATMADVNDDDTMTCFPCQEAS